MAASASDVAIPSALMNSVFTFYDSHACESIVLKFKQTRVYLQQLTNATRLCLVTDTVTPIAKLEKMAHDIADNVARILREAYQDEFPPSAS